MLLDGPSARGQIVLTYCRWEERERERYGKRLGQRETETKRDRERQTKTERDREDMLRLTCQDIVNTEMRGFLQD